MSYTVGQLHKYSVDLYKRLPAETGQDVSLHVTGNLRLATCRERMDEYRKYCGTANTIGVPFEIIGPDAVKALWPLVELGDGRDTAKIVGALYHPDDGHIAPADLTMALRIAARSAGAEIHEHTEVTAAKQTASGEWRLTTNRGEIVAEHVVCATGNYARQTGAMFGLNVPAVPVEHQYIVYDESPELKAYRKGGGRELAVLRESDQSYYLREERLGWILGPYEAGAPARFADGVPDWFGKDLFPGDPRSSAAARRSSTATRACARELRDQGHRQRPDFLHAGWQSADRAGRQGAESVAQRGPQLRDHCSRWGGVATRRVDHRGRAGHRHARGGPAPLRPLRGPALCRREERGNLPQRLHDPLSGRGAPGCAAREDEPGIRQAATHGRRIRPALRLGTRQLVCAGRGRAERRLELPAQQLFRARRQRVQDAARTRRRHRPDAVHETRSERAGRRGVARRARGEQGADTDRPYRAVPRADEARRHPVGIHDHPARRPEVLRRQRGRR